MAEYEPRIETGEASQNREGLNDTGSKCCKEVQTSVCQPCIKRNREMNKR